MDRHCRACGESLVKVWVNSGSGTIILEESKKGGPFTNRRSSAVDAYLCPKCGRVELFAQNPKVFMDANDHDGRA
ncbi:hypothetical protein SAMN05443507_11730 [Alicyclobacillus tolerans]|uniref:Uncharacterized protein n=1 Tax=Alicyclobacillus tolerans TaxID=90970 RepID=A0A1M6TPB7_9BACL|nr:hypothetical protein SAMN05443507_11730 [Alicyclobacillus montanus]